MKWLDRLFGRNQTTLTLHQEGVKRAALERLCVEGRITAIEVQDGLKNARGQSIKTTSPHKLLHRLRRQGFISKTTWATSLTGQYKVYWWSGKLPPKVA